MLTNFSYDDTNDNFFHKIKEVETFSFKPKLVQNVIYRDDETCSELISILLKKKPTSTIKKWFLVSMYNELDEKYLKHLNLAYNRICYLSSARYLDPGRIGDFSNLIFNSCGYYDPLTAFNKINGEIVFIFNGVIPHNENMSGTHIVFEAGREFYDKIINFYSGNLYYNHYNCRNSIYIVDNSLFGRYMLALYTALNGLLYSFYSSNFFTPQAFGRLIHNIIFTDPYVKNWAFKDIKEMLIDYMYSVLEAKKAYYAGPCDFCTALPALVNYCSLISYYGLYSNIKYSSVNEKPADKKILENARLSFSEQVTKQYDIPFLPKTAISIPISISSNGFIPAFLAKDEVCLYYVLVPSTMKVVHNLRKIYGIPENDELYPENKLIRTLLNVQSIGFPELFGKKYDLDYIGLVDIKEFLHIEDVLANDYLFHAFTNKHIHE